MDQFHTFGASSIFAKVESGEINAHLCSESPNISIVSSGSSHMNRPLRRKCRGLSKRQYISNGGIELQTSPQIRVEAVEYYGKF
jgi:hypothetical protein